MKNKTKQKRTKPVLKVVNNFGDNCMGLAVYWQIFSDNTLMTID